MWYEKKPGIIRHYWTEDALLIENVSKSVTPVQKPNVMDWKLQSRVA